LGGIHASLDDDSGRPRVALLTSTGAFAQVPPNPNNPNDNIPEKLSPPPYGELR
jgi:glc operon protein GlcG